MRVQRYTDARAFSDRIAPALEPAERENNVLLGAARRLARSPNEAAFMASVEEDGTIVCAALLVPPFNLLISPAPSLAFEALAEQLQAWHIAIPGVMAPASVSDAFAAPWQRMTRCGMTRGKDVRLLALDALPKATAAPGVLRAAATPHIPVLTEWGGEFFAEVGLPSAERDLFVARLDEEIAAERLWLWEADGRPVSMLGYRETTARAARIGPVYTPRACRGRGFASAAVAEVSRRLLASGRSWCLLFADVENPTSTALYRRLGYDDVCLYREYRFT
ncbi:MAG: GNAT family N-acetyltransferase [Dongiaceae bacterium]